ncbi:hypothetical protein N866_18570 [Actinotalea ferrariae CF5-4]|uniref:Pyrrolo-quinoline quinone repeat domain-containing protein n=1 Tax=Actinotalea ferrariae CF5-4 TaxID=948458 RepID=A0A021VXC9_9CELL|nr:PQQ-binding-like beta-propeller repeat protein [Actinotalea ferrariae]EYR63737.1 hypothetical protein N866_18570 [Actinotalea ferrariae CF5-4]
MVRGRGHVSEGDVDVVLDEGTDDGLDGGPSAGSAPGEGTGPARRVSRRRAAVGAATTALLVVTASTGVQAWQDRADRAALAAVPGVMPRADVAPEEVWSLPGGFVQEASDSVLLVHGLDGGGVTAAVDAATGEVLWRTVDASRDAGWGGCRFVREDAFPWFWGVGTAEPAQEVLCTATDIRADRPVTTTLQVRDARTGTVRAERTVPTEAQFVETVDGDVLHAGYDAAGRLEVVRWEPGADADRWRWRADEVASAGERGFGMLVTEGGVVVQTGDAVTTLSLEDGSEVPEASTEQAVLRVADLVDGAGIDVVLSFTGPATTVVTERDGSLRLEVEAWFAGPRVLDPRTPALLLVEDDGVLVAHDVRDGRELWRGRTGRAGEAGTGPTDPGAPLVQVEHRLVLATQGRLEVVDVRDGTSLWVAEGLDVTTGAAVTDGRSVVVPARVRGAVLGPDALVALDLRDGSEVWRVPLPGPADGLQVVGDVLVVQGVGGLVGLRP